MIAGAGRRGRPPKEPDSRSDNDHTITFDTLKYAKRLKDAGFTESQAEALASAGAELLGENLATKQDLEALRADLQRDMKELEHRLVARIYQALLVQTFALAGIVIALVKLL